MRKLTKEILREMIVEELGIALEVRKYVNEIINKINNGESYGILDCGLQFAITLTYDEYPSANYSKDTNMIEIKMPVGSDNKELYDCIFHEVEHYWQQKNAKKNFGSNELYQASTNYEKEKISNDSRYDYEMLCRVYYFTRKFEIDAYCNGIYGHFYKTGYKGTIEQFFNERPVCALVNVYKNLYNYASNFDLRYKETADAYNVFMNKEFKFGNNPQKWMLFHINDSYCYLTDKLGKIYTLLNRKK